MAIFIVKIAYLRYRQNKPSLVCVLVILRSWLGISSWSYKNVVSSNVDNTVMLSQLIAVQPRLRHFANIGIPESVILNFFFSRISSCSYNYGSELK